MRRALLPLFSLLALGDVVLPGLALLLLAGPAWGQDPLMESPRGEPVLVTATVDRTEAWIGQPVVWTFQLLHSVDILSPPEYHPPSSPGFVAVARPQREVNAEFDGTPFGGAELRLFLFPQAAGTARLGPATVRLVQGAFHGLDRAARPEFFQALFSGGNHGVLASPGFEIQVRPLPRAGRPKEFTGAVGAFRASASVDRAEVRVGQPVELELRVAGEGNLGLFDAPPLPALGDFRVLGTRSEGGLDKDGEIPTGTRTFRTTLVPRRAGEARIRGLAFAWFDPLGGRYRRVELPELRVHVTGGPSPSPVASPPAEVLRLDPEVRGGLPLRSGWLLAAQALPLVGLTLFLAWRPRAPRVPTGVEAIRLRLSSGGDVAGALEGWLEENLGPGFRSLDRRGLDRRLAGAGWPAEHRSGLSRLMDDLDRLRFAPPGVAGADREELARRLLDLARQAPSGGPPVEPLPSPEGAGQARLAARPRWLVALCAFLAMAAPLALVGAWLARPALGAEAAAQAAVEWKAGRPARAAGLYGQALGSGGDSADLWFDMGCALERAGDRPRALAALEVASERAPRDGEIRRRRDALARALGVAGPERRLFVSPGEGLATWSVLACAGVLLWMGRRRALAAASLALGCAGAGVLLFALAADPGGIVLGDAAAVRSGPGRDFAEVAELRPGTRVRLRGPAASWRRITAPGGVEGWVREEQIQSLPGPGAPPSGD